MLGGAVVAAGGAGLAAGTAVGGAEKALARDSPPKESGVSGVRRYAARAAGDMSGTSSLSCVPWPTPAGRDLLSSLLSSRVPPIWCVAVSGS